MAYSNEAVLAKMSSLSETQESIVTVAQWLMFYRKNADITSKIWLDKVKTSNSTKRLNLIYLANEIMQQAKVRNKPEFIHCFGTKVAEAASLAYKGGSQDVQQKVRRVIEIWRERRVLDSNTLKDTEATLNALDKTRPTRSGGPQLGGQLFSSSSVPSEFQPLVTSHVAIAKGEAAARPLIDKANTADQAYGSEERPAVSAPVQIGQLSALIKSLANAESAVSNSIKARSELITGLEKMLEVHKGLVSQETESVKAFSTRRAELDVRRKELEDIITKNVEASDLGHTSGPAATSDGPSASPEMEGFTPPQASTDSTAPNVLLDTQPAGFPGQLEPAPTPAVLDDAGIRAEGQDQAAAATNALDILASLKMPTQQSPTQSPPTNGNDPRKKRKTSHSAAEMEDQMFADGDGIGLDADVAANLGAA